MSKLIILRGLPASGKSTLAKELVEKSGNAVRVNKDLLREMLHFDKFTGKNEEITIESEKQIAYQNLLLGNNVIVDDTNLNIKTYQEWIKLAKEMGVQYETINVTTNYEECIKRDLVRTKTVGKHVIMRMALEAHLVEQPEKGFVIYDIDGTIADIEHRRHHVMGEKKDWGKFFEGISEDKPRKEIVDNAMHDEQDGYGIILVSGRGEEYRKPTEEWLEKHFPVKYTALLMRPAKNSRPDTEIKQNIYNKCLAHYNIVKVVDDRPRVIRMWRELGLNVVDVGDGVEF